MPLAEALLQPVPTAAPRLLRRPEVLHRTGIKAVATLYKMMSNGQFPRPVKIGAKAVAWREPDVQQWIDTRVEAGPAPQG